MAELEISIMSTNSGSDPETELRSVLGDFGTRHGDKIMYTVYDWNVAWMEIMKIVLNKKGPRFRSPFV